ncbi:hypothetical protein LCGC14_2715350, partial [marine sediment metagenome]
SQKMASVAIEIPHTRGLGRKLLGDPFRELSQGLRGHSKKYKKIADAIGNTHLGFDAYRPIMNGLREGTLAPWQFHIIANSIDNIHNQNARNKITIALGFHRKELTEAAEAAGQDPDRVMRTLLDDLEGISDEKEFIAKIMDLGEVLEGTDTITVKKGTVAAEEHLQSKIDAAADYIRLTIDEYHATMLDLDPSFKANFVDGYIRQSYTPEGRAILQQFTDGANNVPFQEWASAAERGEPGKGIMARLMHAMGIGGGAETNLGSGRYLDDSGRMQMLQMTDDGPLLMDENYITDTYIRNKAPKVVDEAGVVRGDAGAVRPSVAKINEWLEVAVRENAEEYGIKLPKNWDGKVFKENPLEAASDYVGLLDDTIRQWGAINSMRHAGLVVGQSTAIDVQDVLQRMMGNIHRISQKVTVRGTAVGAGAAAAAVPI